MTWINLGRHTIVGTADELSSEIVEAHDFRARSGPPVNNRSIKND